MTKRAIQRLYEEGKRDAERDACQPLWWDDASYIRWQGDPVEDAECAERERLHRLAAESRLRCPARRPVQVSPDDLPF